MKNKTFSLSYAASILGMSILTACSPKSYELKEWIQSERDNYWQQQEVTVAAETSDKAVTVLIDPTQTAQTVDGFGTCFNELGWASLQLLPETELQKIFSELFTPGQGANFVMGRMGIGANDFALDYYSLDDTDGDFELKDFSIERDKKNLIPMIKWAMKYNADLKIWGSPWCPPRWMKKTKHYAEKAVTPEMVQQWEEMMAKMKEAAKSVKPGEEGGVSATSGFFSDGPLAFRMERRVNDALPGEEGFENITSFNMQPEYLDAYARYFGKYVDAYKEEGVPVFMVMPQNEPNSAQPYPSCSWTSEDLNTFVGKYLGPEMEKHGVDVYFGTVERADPLKVDTLLNDPDSKKYVKGVGFQWAGKDALPTIYKNHPELKLYQSEQECGNGKNNWEGALHAWDLMRHYLSNGVNAYFYWNTSLFYEKASTWGWYQNSLVTVNEADHSWTYTPDYYALKHASHYVLPGAKRILLNCEYEDIMAFVNPDSSIAVLVGNQTAESVNLNLKIDDQQVNVTLKPESIHTLLLRK